MILAIDGASTDLSVALSRPDGTAVAGVSWTAAQRQSAELLPRILDLLASADRRLADLTAIAVGAGPGSFTGLRVAMALAKGLAFGLDRPIVGVPSLVAWLEGAPDAHAGVARAGAREAYLLARGADGPEIVDRDELGRRLAGHSIVAPVELVEAFALADARAPDGGPAVARLAAQRLAAEPAGDDLSRLEPIYLRAPRGLAAAPEGEVKWL
ncbi:MAG TPA: tRNA (adenosine(37)-N6)-threonylcarbamoyltransferase complex dimerization subunit type 1 TsaB [Candidatus Limnocylindria bacterium]